MPRMNAARPALAAWMLLAAPVLAQTSAPSGYIRTRDAGEVENTFGTAVNYVLRF